MELRGANMKKMKLLKKVNRSLAIIFVSTFAIYWFNLDNKLLYYVVYPRLQKRYDKIDLTRDKHL